MKENETKPILPGGEAAAMWTRCKLLNFLQVTAKKEQYRFYFSRTITPELLPIKTP